MCNYLLIDSKACRLSERAKRPFDPSFRLDRVKREEKVVENREGLCYSFSIEKTKRNVKLFQDLEKRIIGSFLILLFSRVVSDSYAISKSFKTLLGRTG